MTNQLNMNNTISMIKSFMNKGNPQQLIQQMIGNNNPMFNNLMQMAQSGNSKGLENFARNYCKERGKDFDKEFSNFMSNFK